MPIYIPDEVKILEKIYTVKFDKSLSVEKDCAAEIRYRTNEIRLMPDLEGDSRHYQSIEASFFHEVLHGILHAMSYFELNDDEAFVCRVSKCLYQTLRDSGMLVKANE